MKNVDVVEVEVESSNYEAPVAKICSWRKELNSLTKLITPTAQTTGIGKPS